MHTLKLKTHLVPLSVLAPLGVLLVTGFAFA